MIHCDLLFDWEAFDKSVKAMWLAGIHRLSINEVEPRCVTMLEESPNYPGWTLHVNDKGIPVLMALCEASGHWLAV